MESIARSGHRPVTIGGHATSINGAPTIRPQGGDIGLDSLTRRPMDGD